MSMGAPAWCQAPMKLEFPGPTPANSTVLRTSWLPSITLKCFKDIISFNPHGNLAKNERAVIRPSGETGL